MTNNYKVIYRLDTSMEAEIAPKWELGCPISIQAVQVSRNTETAGTYLQCRLKNIAEKTITSVSGEASIIGSQGEIERIIIKELDFDVEAKQDRTIKAVKLSVNEVASASFKVLQVIYADKTKWISKKEPETPPIGSNLVLSKKAFAERALELDEAGVNSPHNAMEVLDESSWWACACGQHNVLRSKCLKCGATKKMLIELQDEISLEKKADERQRKLAEKKTKTKKIVKCGVILAGSVTAIAIITLIVLQIFHINQASLIAKKNEEAASLIAKKNEEAIAKSQKISDSEPENMYQYVKEYYSASNLATVKFLTQLALDNYKDSQALFSQLANYKVELITTADSESTDAIGNTVSDSVNFKYKITSEITCWSEIGYGTDPLLGLAAICQIDYGNPETHISTRKLSTQESILSPDNNGWRNYFFLSKEKELEGESDKVQFVNFMISNTFEDQIIEQRRVKFY